MATLSRSGTRLPRASLAAETPQKSSGATEEHAGDSIAVLFWDCRSVRIFPGQDNPSFPERTRDSHQASDRSNPRRRRDCYRGRVGSDTMVCRDARLRSEEHTSELQSLMRIS